MPSFLILFPFSSSLVLALTHWLYHMRGWLCGKGGRIIDADGNNVWGSECYLCGWEIQDGAKVASHTYTHTHTHTHTHKARTRTRRACAKESACNQENEINTSRRRAKECRASIRWKFRELINAPTASTAGRLCGALCHPVRTCPPADPTCPHA